MNVGLVTAATVTGAASVIVKPGTSAATSAKKHSMYTCSLEAIAIRMEAIATRLEGIECLGIGHYSKCAQYIDPDTETPNHR